MRILARLFLALVLFATLSSCGYRLLDREAPLEFSSIHVSAVRNSTSEPNLEDYLHQGLVEELLLDRRVSVVDGEAADVVLETTIVSFHLQATVVTDNYASTYDIRMEADFRLVDRRSGKVIRTMDHISAPIKTSFDVTKKSFDALASQEKAEKDACRSLARQVINRALLK